MKNLLEFQNQLFQYAVNRAIDLNKPKNYDQDLSKYDSAEVKIGLEKEQEHTDDPRELSKIVADHLEEDPAYYSKMEKAGFDESMGIIQKNIKSEIDEGRSQWRWTNSLVRELKSYVMELLKNDLEHLIKERYIVYNKNIFWKKFSQYPIMRWFGDIHIVLENGRFLQVGGAFYAPHEFTENVLGHDISFKRGDFLFKIIIPEKAKTFDDIKNNLQSFSTDFTEISGHEFMHFVDDFKDHLKGLEPEGEQDIFYKMPKHYIEKYNYYMSDREARAYVEGAMKIARMKRITFVKALYKTVFLDRLTPFFKRSTKFKDITCLIMYKYLRYAMRKYNKVMDSPAANRYFLKLENYIKQNGLEKYVPDVESIEKEKKTKEKEKRRQEWEKQNDGDEYLEEGKNKLSKYWHKRAKSRAKRAGRHFPNNKDKEWAEQQEEKSKDISTVLKKAFEGEIKESDNITKNLSEIVSNFKQNKDPFVHGIKGRAKGFKKKHKGSMKVAPGEQFGPLGENE